jgi:hypothetical protein
MNESELFNPGLGCLAQPTFARSATLQHAEQLEGVTALLPAGAQVGVLTAPDQDGVAKIAVREREDGPVTEWFVVLAEVQFDVDGFVRTYPPLPLITDGTGGLDSATSNLWLEPQVGLELDVQFKEDGSYRTSVLTFGRSLRRLDVFATRDQMERLYKLIGRHLEQLDDYEQARNTLRAEEGQG